MGSVYVELSRENGRVNTFVCEYLCLFAVASHFVGMACWASGAGRLFFFMENGTGTFYVPFSVCTMCNICFM